MIILKLVEFLIALRLAMENSMCQRTQLITISLNRECQASKKCAHFITKNAQRNESRVFSFLNRVQLFSDKKQFLIMDAELLRDISKENDESNQNEENKIKVICYIL